MTTFVHGVQGQQTPNYSLYMLNKYQFNPAYAGMEASLSVNGIYRTQWSGIEGNPVQQHLDAHLPFYILNGGIGMSFDRETIGAEVTTRMSVSYNYVYESAYGLFSAGLSAGLIQKGLDGSKLRAPDGDYEGTLIIHNDANLPQSMVRGAMATFAVGGYFAGDQLEAGIAITNILPATIELEGATYKARPVVNGYVEYRIPVSTDIDLYPSAFMQTDFTQMQLEVSARAEYRGFLTFGLGLRGYSNRSLDAFTILFGLDVSDHVSLAYAYDLTLSRLQQVSSGSHEFTIRYNLRKTIGAGLPPPAIYSPRFY